MASTPPPATGAAMGTNAAAPGTLARTRADAYLAGVTASGVTGATAGTGAGLGGTTGTSNIGKFEMTGGWFIVIVSGVTVLLANTRVGPIMVGILGVGLLFQLEKLLKGQ